MLKSENSGILTTHENHIQLFKKFFIDNEETFLHKFNYTIFSVRICSANFMYYSNSTPSISPCRYTFKLNNKKYELCIAMF